MFTTIRTITCLVMLLLWPVRAHAELTLTPVWETPTYDVVRLAVHAWLGESSLSQEIRDQIRQQWPTAVPDTSDAENLLDRVAETLALSDPRAATLVNSCLRQQEILPPDEMSWLLEADQHDFVRSNLRLLHARLLLWGQHYDQVLSELDQIDVVDVVDPATLLFCRMIACHQLVRPEASREALAQLLVHEEALPSRYRQLAQLLQRDLATLDDESLDHIARRMQDVQRRLTLGQTDGQIQKVQKGVLASLDTLIDSIEKQQQNSASAMGGSSPSAKPMQESRPAGLKAPGRVDPRDIGNESGWGNLPPKQRQQAMQQIGREYPAYYREMIEQYFRRLANEGEKSEP